MSSYEKSKTKAGSDTGPAFAVVSVSNDNPQISASGRHATFVGVIRSFSMATWYRNFIDKSFRELLPEGASPTTCM